MSAKTAPPSIEHRSVMHGQDSTNRILINRNAEGQGGLLDNPRTAPRRIALFYSDNGANQIGFGTSSPRLRSLLWRKQ